MQMYTQWINCFCSRYICNWQNHYHVLEVAWSHLLHTNWWLESSNFNFNKSTYMNNELDQLREGSNSGGYSVWVWDEARECMVEEDPSIEDYGAIDLVYALNTLT